MSLILCENIWNAPPCHHATMVEDGDFIFEDSNLEVNHNCITGSRVTAVFLNEWILSYVLWWSSSGGGSAINGATPSIFFLTIDISSYFHLLLFHLINMQILLRKFENFYFINIQFLSHSFNIEQRGNQLEFEDV